jgi:glycosyltransferase involved in cell wall biosynthesis
MKEPFVSLLVPVYNQEKKLHRALMSIDNAISKSAYKDIQVILYDDGSTDFSSYIMHDWEEKKSCLDDQHCNVKTINGRQNAGYGHAMNEMLEAADGKYIGILEPDDELAENYFNVFDDIVSVSDYDVIKAMYLTDNEECSLAKQVLSEGLAGSWSKDFPIELLMHHPSIWSAAYRADFLKENDIKFEQAPGAGWVDNLFLFETILLAKSIYVSDDIVYSYSKTQTGNSMVNFNADVPIRRMYAVRNWLKLFYHAKTREDIPEDILYAFSFRVAQYIDLIVNKYRVASEQAIQMLVDGLVQWCSVELLYKHGNNSYADQLRMYQQNLWLKD